MTNFGSNERDAASQRSNGSKKGRTRSRRTRSSHIVNDQVVDEATIGSGSRPPTESTPAGGTLTDVDVVRQPMPNGGGTVTSRYQCVEEVGRGGWGIVEKAIDHQLGREVAVKRFTDDGDVTEQERQRFFHEAKVTSQLQHPGIVPVHELGDRLDAFYVMKLLDGITLLDCVERHHEEKISQQKQTPFQLGQSLEPLLQRFVDVCNAVAYAHQRGVIHRDLKPSNIMIGNFGETTVLDWGLAQSVEPSPDKDRSTKASSDKAPPDPCCLNAHVSSLIEPDGTVIGTPAYMAPEQAAGDVARINRASDIYALGTILYTIIAGRNPYQGQTVDEILGQVKTGSFPSLRGNQPSVPKPLLSIVNKAMAFAQQDRYSSADQLASDVRRFIAGDRVSVHHENTLERGIRWCRHHQGIAASIAISLSVLLLSSIVFGVVIKRSHIAERSARIEAERSHREAIASLGEAHEATNTWLIELSGSLQFYPGMANLRSELLDRAIEQYDRITLQNLASSSTPDRATFHESDLQLDASHLKTQQLARLERAKAFLRLGDLYRLTGKLEQSRDNYLAAETLLNKYPSESDGYQLTQVSLSAPHPLMKSDTDPLSQRFDLERINTLIGQLLIGNQTDATTVSWDRVQAARRCLDQTLDQSRSSSKQIKRIPVAPFVARITSTYVRLEMAVRFATTENPSFDGESNDNRHENAIHVARWLADQRGTASDRRLSETIQTEHCRRLCDSGSLELAEVSWSLLIGDLNSWLESDPDRIDYLQSLSHALLQHGNCLVALERGKEATSDFETAIRLLEAAWRKTDADGFFRINLATAENNLGQLLSRGGQQKPALAVQLLRQSLATYEALLREEVTADRIRRYAQTHHALAEAVTHLPDADSKTANLDSARIQHLQKASSAFKILCDYETLSNDDILRSMKCELDLASHHSNGGRAIAYNEHYDQFRKQLLNLDRGSLTPVQSDLLRQLIDEVTDLKLARTSPGLTRTIDSAAKTGTQLPKIE